MTYIIKIIYSLLFPPGLYIIAMIVLSGFFLVKKKYKAACALLIISLIFYISTCNFAGYMLMQRIEGQYPFPNDISGDCILVLGEGASLDTPSVDGLGELSGDMALNVIAALKLYNKLHVPILLSGGTGIGGNGSGNEAQLAKRDLIAMKVPGEMIILEDKSHTTLENANNSAVILQDKGFKKPILVTTSPHLSRSVDLFRQKGIEVLPLPTRYSPIKELQYNLFDFLPSTNGIFMVQRGLKESLGKLQQFMM